MMTRGARRILTFWLPLAAILIFFVFPFAWMLMGSFKTQADFMSYPPKWLFRPTLMNYKAVFVGSQFPQFALNSLIIALGSTVLGLVLGIPAAYSIARYRQRRLGVALLTARMAPGIALLVPWFIFFSRLHMLDTYFAVMLTHMTVVLPLVIWVLVGFFEDVSPELEEAAQIDGCSRVTQFYRITLPIVSAGIMATAILGIIASWNNFLFSLVVTGDSTRTLPVAVFNYMQYDALNWGSLTAASTIITLPVLAMVFFIQKYIVRGMSFGALKG